MARPGPKPKPYTELIARHVVVTANGCHIWTGALGPKGYPYMSVRESKGPRAVHLVLWETLKGPRPKGFDVHHKCRNKLCVNIEHLKLKSHAQHAREHRATQRRNLRRAA